MTIQITTNQGESLNLNFMGFAGGERHVQIENIPREKVKSVNIFAQIFNSNDVMDLLLIENALRHQFGSHLLINLELPYLPYARQDRVCADGQAFSLEVFARLLESLRLNHLMTWDCHSQLGLDLTGAVNVSAADILKQAPVLINVLKAESSVLICPDKGALKRCEEIQKTFDLAELVICEKTRNPASGKIEKTIVLADDLSGQCAVITDDICDGGFTFIKIAEQLRQKNVEKIILFVTHGIFSKGLDVFEGLIDEIVTTNSFPQQENRKLSVIELDNAIYKNVESKTGEVK